MIEKTVILDSNVILDATGPATTRETTATHELFRAIEGRRVDAIVMSPVLVEVYYITYRAFGSIRRSEEIIDRLLGMDGVTCLGVSDVVAKRAGNIAVIYNYETIGKAVRRRPTTDSLSLVDCIVLAAGTFDPPSIVCSHEKKFKEVSEATTRTPLELMNELR